MSQVTKRLRIYGRVQGVFFRASMREEAAKLGLKGWVRNRKDGTVEALVQGQASAVEAIAKWAERGPRDAEVERVETSEMAAAEAFSDFSQWPTT